MGPDNALLTTGMTIGSLNDAAIYTISCINARPFDAVAVIALAPALLAPTVALIAECSLSTLISSESTIPSDTKSENFSAIDV